MRLLHNSHFADSKQFPASNCTVSCSSNMSSSESDSNLRLYTIRSTSLLHRSCLWLVFACPGCHTSSYQQSHTWTCFCASQNWECSGFRMRFPHRLSQGSHSSHCQTHHKSFSWTFHANSFHKVCDFARCGLKGSLGQDRPYNTRGDADHV